MYKLLDCKDEIKLKEAGDVPFFKNKHPEAPGSNPKHIVYVFSIDKVEIELNNFCFLDCEMNKKRQNRANVWLFGAIFFY